jgi:hypothetical protein
LPRAVMALTHSDDPCLLPARASSEQMKLSRFSGFGVPFFVGPLVPRQLPEGCSIQCVRHIADQIAAS